MLTVAHDPMLVAVSVLLAILASYTALDLAGRIREASGWACHAWLAAAALAMGGGIWSMHFVGMLAFRVPMAMSYDVGLTLLSLVVPIVVTGIAFLIIGRGAAGWRTIGLAAIDMGLGIVFMHYTGMAAMRMPAHLSYDPALVGLSIVIAIGASAVGLSLAFRMARLRERIAAAVALGIAIAGMHYTGMAAARFVMHEPGAMPDASGLEQPPLAASVAATTVAILFLGLVAAMFDRRFAVLAEREAAALRVSEERFRTLYNKSPMPLHSVDSEDRLLAVSDFWLDLLGYERDEVLGHPLASFMSEASARFRREIGWPRLLEEGEARDQEYQMVKRTGELRDVLVSARVERDAAGRFVRTMGAIVDITDQRRVEDALRQSHKMESIGQLTGGIAHDFNNLLTVVLGHLDLLGRKLPDDAKLRRSLEAALGGAQRAAALTQRLLAFSRRQMLQPQPLDLNEVVRGLTELLHRMLGEAIRIETRLAPGLWGVFADPNQLETTLLNLVINARDAMPEGGRLTIETANIRLDRGDVRRRDDLAAGDYVMVAVADTGIGMTRETLSKIFEPFFTTKEVGQGTGLGLSQAYGFVRQSSGNIEAESTPGVGTTMKIYLPRHVARLDAARDAEAERALPAGRADETVLVVEDDAAVRTFSTEALRDLGYRVVEAGDAAAALDALEREPGVRLLFTDVGLPGTNGAALAAEVVRRRPGLPVLYTTGYARTAVVRDGVVDAGIEMLPKPFTVLELAPKVRALIGGAAVS